MLHLANRLGWLRRSEDGVVHLTGNRVHHFLEQTRSEQRQSLWESGANRPNGTISVVSRNWNAPKPAARLTIRWQTRNSLLRLLRHSTAWRLVQSGRCHRGDSRSTEPDFQRPTGNYDTWYIRDTTTQEFLKGFEQWDAVEGALLRFLFRGPLHWLGRAGFGRAVGRRRYADFAEPVGRALAGQ